jgi:hypothetical protein
MDDPRTIRVTGRGSAKLAPDATRLTMTLRGTEKEYTAALERSAERTEALKDALAPLGFGRDELRTLSFSVDIRYESDRDENGEYRQRFAGYEYTHSLKLEFDRDNERLGRTLHTLATGSVEAEFHIGYFLRDAEAAKNALLAEAVSDAKAKAAVIADAAGVKLGAIRVIDYSWGNMNLEVMPVPRMMNVAAKAEASFDMDINPEDIEVSDQVTVVWEIF